MANSITTVLSRQNQAKAEAGQAALMTVAKMSFGNGAEPAGVLRAPLTTDAALQLKLVAVAIEAITYPTTTTVRFTARLTFAEATTLNKNINEVGLEDAAGNTMCIKTFPGIPKTSENEFVVEWDEAF